MVLGGEPRSLTLPEFRELRKIEDLDAADVFMLSKAFDVDEQAAWDYLNAAPMSEAVATLQSAWVASGLTEEAGFPDPQGNDAGVERGGEPA